jgi:hypothetical protein
MAVKDIDRGYKKFVREINKARTLEVAVGIFENARNDEGEKIAEYAAYNEYGTSKIPARPFMALSVDRNKAEIKKDIDEGLARITSGAGTVEKELNRIGAKHVERIQATITGPNIPPPLSPATVAKKGNNKTLVDTSAMVNAVTWEIRIK